MKATKKNHIIYWIATIIIFLFEGVIPALTSQTELAKEGIHHLGYPGYFLNVLVIFKILGALVLIIPRLPLFLKTFAYTGFTFTFLFACIGHAVVDGFDFQTILPLIFLGILFVSYTFYKKTGRNETAASFSPVKREHAVPA